MSRATYTARSTRSGDWWAVEIEELDGVFTQARRLDQVEAMARDAIALTLDEDPSSFDVVIRPVLPPNAEAVLNRMRRSRETAELTAQLAALEAKMAVVMLHEQQRLPLRDIGRVLGVSHQRAHQLLDEDLADVLDQIAALESRLDTSKRIPINKLRTKLGLG